VRVRADDGGTDKGEADVLYKIQPDGSRVVELNSPIENLNTKAQTRLGVPAGGGDKVLADLVDAGNNNYDGLTSKWYGQTSNKNDASQSNASRQPQIVSSGSVTQDNGQPTIQGKGQLKAGDTLSLQTSGTKFSFYSVTKPVDETSLSIIDKQNEYTIRYFNNTSSNNSLYLRHSTFGGNSGILSDNTQIGIQYLFSVHSTAGTGGEIYKNGSLYVDHSNTDTSSKTNNAVLIGDRNDQINLQEIIIYKDIRHSISTIGGIESNINDHYSIF
jgi:hypothetical protein